MGILQTNASSYYDSGGAHGNYRFISMSEIIDSFMATYVGKGKICESVLSQDVTFHALRGIQELSYDTLRSVKDWEVEIPESLLLVMPIDFVNYVKLSFSDESGMERIIYPAHKTSNPLDVSTATSPNVESWGGWKIDSGDTDLDSDEESDTWEAYKKDVPVDFQNDDYEDNYYNRFIGERYGIDPQHAQVNGSFYIDESAGKFHFSSNLSGKTVILKYISDGIATDKSGDAHTIDMVNTLVPKLAEEAIYKHILYGVLSARKDTPPYLLAQVKKERFAETRKAKIRLSNIKLEELTQVLRGKSKWIKH